MDKAGTMAEAGELLGLQESDTQVLAHLQRHGLLSAAEIARAVGVHRAQAHRSLNRLEAAGAIDVIAGRPTLFQAVPLARLLQSRMLELQTRLARLAAMAAAPAIPRPAPATGEGSTGLVRLVGEKAIASALGRMAQEAERSFAVRSGPPIKALDIEAALTSDVYAGLHGRGVRVRAVLGPPESEIPQSLPAWADVRFANEADGVRYAIADGATSLFWTNPQAAPDAQTAVLTDGPAMARVLTDDFARAWERVRAVRA